ncbi:hypothetical protein FRC98_16915 [Lujinxingia vulgaris]|uniref:Uncharacterized protein n=1 Tax=Lujinxingia vulgaris TaxID=2600176 RepID=A0A5C6X1X8_9DELT|nr:hypothetical protein [Lujinxingia vulgaris]TXD35152.1 hypothetical protein FRC98_16915 [Lujinxingia vulgaris]
MLRYVVVGAVVAGGVWSAGMEKAEACSEPQAGVTLEVERLEGMPLDGAIVASLDRGEDDWGVTVTREDGEVVAGTTEVVSYGVVEEYEWRQAILVWTPDEHWEAQQSYSVVIELENDYATGQPWERAEASFTTGEATMASQDAFAFVDTEFSTSERATRSECCARECEPAACEWGSDCADCWGVTFAPHPTVTSTLQIDAPAADAAQYLVEIKDGDGEAVVERWMSRAGTVGATIVYPPDAASPYCAHVEVTRLATGETFTLEPACVEAPEGTSFEEVERDERPEWVSCGDDGDDGGDVGGGEDVGGGDDVGPDAGEGDEENDGGEEEGAGGCAVVDQGAGGGGGGWAMMLLAAMGVRRKLGGGGFAR